MLGAVPGERRLQAAWHLDLLAGAVHVSEAGLRVAASVLENLCDESLRENVVIRNRPGLLTEAVKALRRRALCCQ